jgi:hypothetical protein
MVGGEGGGDSEEGAEEKDSNPDKCVFYNRVGSLRRKAESN